MNFRKHRGAAALLAAVILTASCAQKTETPKGADRSYFNGAGELTAAEVLAAAEGDYEEGAEAEIINAAGDKFADEETAALIDDALLPFPDMDICGSFTGNDMPGGGEYYEEFREFNVPMAMTARVSAYIKYFTERVPKTTQAWLDRSNKYMYLVRDIFIKEGLPSDLVVLAFTESGFNTHAVSHAGAAGMWQFIPSTGKLYGMRVNFWVDERRDFEKATYAAAKYLKALYARFGDWYLALAAYNAGPGKIARATKKHETKDFFKISKNRYTLKLETRDYVPKFLAQLIIYKNYLKYNFTPPSGMPLLYSSVTVPSQTNLYWLAEKLGVESGVLMELNPALKLPMTPPGEYSVRVPYGMGEAAETLLASAGPEERAVYRVYNARQGEKISSIAAKTGSTPGAVKKVNGLKYDTVFASRPLFIPVEGITDAKIDAEFSALLARLAPQYYKVKRGDTFIEIAHRHSMRLADLQRLNPGVRASRIYPGQQLVVSEGAASAKRTAVKRAASRPAAVTASLPNNGKYKVRSGDSLWSIAKKFGTTVDAIMADNNLSGHSIQAGKVLSIKR